MQEPSSKQTPSTKIQRTKREFGRLEFVFYLVLGILEFYNNMYAKYLISLMIYRLPAGEAFG
jgi:hypothetical protein